MAALCTANLLSLFAFGTSVGIYVPDDMERETDVCGHILDRTSHLTSNINTISCQFGRHKSGH